MSSIIICSKKTRRCKDAYGGWDLEVKKGLPITLKVHQSPTVLCFLADSPSQHESRHTAHGRIAADRQLI